MFGKGDPPSRHGQSRSFSDMLEIQMTTIVAGPEDRVGSRVSEGVLLGESRKIHSAWLLLMLWPLLRLFCRNAQGISGALRRRLRVVCLWFRLLR
jgi:hypothetical protein